MDKKKVTRRLCVLAFMVYIGILVYFLFFAEMMGRDANLRVYSYNLEPFKEIGRFIRYRRKLGAAAVWLNLAGNVAAFMPFGAFVPALFKRHARLWQTAFLTMAFSLLIECIQLASKVGSFDVDDIILNTLGGLLGGLLYKGYAAIINRKQM